MNSDGQEYGMEMMMVYTHALHIPELLLIGLQFPLKGLVLLQLPLQVSQVSVALVVGCSGLVLDPRLKFLCC